MVHLLSLQLYRSGIYSDDKCSSERLDHVVQIVGYGVAHDSDYWILKNSWGETGLIKHFAIKHICLFCRVHVYTWSPSKTKN